MRNSSGMTDPLSDVLDLADTRCVLTGTLIAGGNWGRKFKRSQAVKFLAVVRGACWLTTDANASTRERFEAGDVLITNGAPGIILASDPEWLVDPPSAPLGHDDRRVVGGR